MYLYRTLLGIAVVSLLLSACGGGSSSSTPPTSTSSSSSSSSSSASSSGGFCPVDTQGSINTTSNNQNTAISGNILVFSRTAGFRHSSITQGISMLQNLAGNNGWAIDVTEDSTSFTASNLEQYNVIVWLNTTGDVLNSTQQSAFEDFIEGGGGYVGIHSAADTEYDWPWYGNLVGAYFQSHPHIQLANINVEDHIHPATSHLGTIWSHTDEWYNYRANPRDNVSVLLSLDEDSYDPGSDFMGDHPIAWRHEVGEGRSFYTGLGHTAEAYSNPDFIAHIEGALQWAGRMQKNLRQWNGNPPPDSDFTTSAIATGINLPMAMEISPDGDVFVIGRMGNFYAMENNQLVSKTQLLVDASLENGLIGFALAPDFTESRHAFFHYTSATTAEQIISRITVRSDNQLDLNSELILLRYPTFDDCCHVAGDMAFDSVGNLYIATGDNTNPFQSSGYTPIDERPGREHFDAQRTSANTNDLRGKILRIKPTPEGGYTIPDGNLFTADSQHRAEIYTMGLRNPFRISIDTMTDFLFWGDIGPDANSASSDRGPTGLDEINRTALPGNFGWPYFAGQNLAYMDYDFATGDTSGAFNPVAVENNSVNNTGTNQLPDTIPAWFSVGHRAIMVADVYRWNAAVTDRYKLPSYFNGRILAWNFNNDTMFELEVNADSPEARAWLDTSLLVGIIDTEISPVTNRLYLLSYGDNCCGSPPFSGTLAEVRYIGDGDGSTHVPELPFEAGDTVSFGYDGRFVSAPTNSPLSLVNTNALSDAELFEVVDTNDGAVAFRSLSSGLYITSSDGGNGELIANATDIGLEQQFEFIQNNDGSQSLRAYANCQYVSVSNSPSPTLSANLGSRDATAQFQFSHATACTEDPDAAIACRPNAAAFLNMPSTLANDLSNVPGLLSQTGAFDDMENLSPSESMIPYDLIAPLWSDRAEKHRWMSIPSGSQVVWAEEGKWQWPIGTVMVKHFELPIDEAQADLVQRLETRIIVVQEDGSIYGVTYKWRADNSDADLLTESFSEDITIQSTNGEWTQTWNYPGPADCITCHNSEAQGILGPKTASLNKSWRYPSGVEDNQLSTLVNLGLFSDSVDLANLDVLPAHAYIADDSKTLEHRLRSYWDINCGNCHGPQGIAARWDARYETPLESQGIINGELAGQRDYMTDYGLIIPFVVDPGDSQNSILYIRDKSINPDDRMPPLGRELEDEVYMEVLEQWINALP